MNSTRQRILNFLKNRRPVTAEELSHALHMTSANIRHHLAILLKRGSIETVGERPPIGRGRPAKLYSLSHKDIGENLDMLSSVLLKDALASYGKDSEEQKTFFRRIARRMMGETKPLANLSQKLFQTVRRLNQMNYQARWEARVQSPVLILEHCPYLSIIKEHPELCTMDACILEEMLGVPVEQTAKLAQNPEGGTYCTFKIIPVSR